MKFSNKNKVQFDLKMTLRINGTLDLVYHNDRQLMENTIIEEKLLTERT